MKCDCPHCGGRLKKVKANTPQICAYCEKEFTLEVTRTSRRHEGEYDWLDTAERVTTGVATLGFSEIIRKYF